MNFKYLKYLLLTVDFLIIRVSFFLSTQIIGVSNINMITFPEYARSPEFFSFFLLSFVAVGVLYYKRLYSFSIVLSFLHQFLLIFISIFYFVIVLTFIAFFVKSPWIIDSRLVVIYFSLFSIGLLTIYRLALMRPLVRMLNKKGIFNRNVIIVGSDIIAQSFAAEMSVDNHYGLQHIGFVDRKLPLGKRIFQDKSVLGSVDQLPEIVERFNIDEIIIAESEEDYNGLLEIIDICKKTKAHVNIASQLFSIVHQKVTIDSYFEIPIAPVKRTQYSEFYWAIKRFIDVFGSIAGIVLLSPPLLIIAFFIKVTSPGPIFYHQTRIGKDGQPFKFYKFRSMKVGSDADDQRRSVMYDFIKGRSSIKNGSTKVVNETNITTIGKLLRKTSLDELPQLINVLKGDMSLVGPRPCLPYEYEAYNDWHKRRLSILPGCTGLWQVSSRSETGFNEMVVLDLYYIANTSIMMDLQLILKTIPVMLFGRGGK